MTTVIVLAFAFLLRPFWQIGQESARRSSCLSNVRQLGLSLAGYAEDYDDAFPWRVGASRPQKAWSDLGLLHPEYLSVASVLHCPGDKDATSSGLYSYSYSFDNTGRESGVAGSGCVPWTEKARASVRLLADKKAGVAMTAESNHWYGGYGGRNVLYGNGHAGWKRGNGALDPDEESKEIGAPGAPDYRAWWSDPPYYGE